MCTRNCFRRCGTSPPTLPSRARYRAPLGVRRVSVRLTERQQLPFLCCAGGRPKRTIQIAYAEGIGNLQRVEDLRHLQAVPLLGYPAGKVL